jgi:hypothetical protein
MGLTAAVTARRARKVVDLNMLKGGRNVGLKIHEGGECKSHEKGYCTGKRRCDNAEGAQLGVRVWLGASRAKLT